MKRSAINVAIDRARENARKNKVGLPAWAGWNPEQFDDERAAGIRDQGLGWILVDFGVDDFDHCGLIVFVLSNPLVDGTGEPLTATTSIGSNEYTPAGFSRKYLFVQSGQSEPHHFHRQKVAKFVTVLSGAVRFELAWADGDKALSDKPVRVQVDGIFHDLQANGDVTLKAGETILLPAELSHIIEVIGDEDVIMLETSTANNNNVDNIFPFMTPSATQIEEDEKPRYRQVSEYRATRN